MTGPDKKVLCSKAGCAMRGIPVTTSIERCLSCGEILEPAANLAQLFDDLLGRNK
jgi:hypothetical protein